MPKHIRLRTVVAACLSLCFLVAGCGDDAPVSPTELSYQGQAITPGALSQPLPGDIRLMVTGMTEGDEPQKLPVPNARVRFDITRKPEGARGASFSSPDAYANAAGLVQIAFLVGDKPGLYRLEASLPEYPDVKPVAINVLGGVIVSGAGQDGWVGNTLKEPFSLRLEKAPGEFVAEEDGLVRFTLMGAPDGTRLGANLGRTNAEGVAATSVDFGGKQGRTDVGVTILGGIPGDTSQLAPMMFHFFAIDVWSVTISMLGGLALFLFGMRTMSESLQFVAGEKLRDLLNLLTTNRFMAVGAGAMVTALIQSSSACTVMVVGFVNAGIMRLEQAIGVVMGANIGTTITAQVISLKLNLLALPAIAVGVAVLFAAKRPSTRHWATIVIGFGVLFLGMNIMSGELGQLRESAGVVSLFQGLHCEPGVDGYIPLFQFLKAVFCGVVVTLILQSSSATIGILIAVAAAGLIDPYAAFGILLGDNIGTTITAILASIGTTTTARRAAIFHVTFNVFGCVLMILLNYVQWPGRPGRPVFMELANILTPGDVFQEGENLPRFIANAHTLFNVGCTTLFVSFVPQFARLCRWLIKSAPEEAGKPTTRRTLEPHLLAMPSLALQQVWTEVGSMLEKAREAQHEGYSALINDPSGGGDWNKMAKEAKNLEKETDELQHAITKYMSEISLTTLNENQAELFPHLVRTVNDAERVADNGKDLSKLAKRVNKRSMTLTPAAVEDMNRMKAIVDEILQLAEKTVNINADGIERSGGGAVLRAKLLEQGKRLDKEAKATATALRKNHEARHDQGVCDFKSGVVFMEVAELLQRSAGCARNIIEAACHTQGEPVKK